LRRSSPLGCFASQSINTLMSGRRGLDRASQWSPR